MPIDGHVSGLGSVKHGDFAMASGEMSEPEFIAFLSEVARAMAAHSRDGAIHYVCMDWRHIFELLTAGRSIYSELKNLCVWTKTNGGMGSLYRVATRIGLGLQEGLRGLTSTMSSLAAMAATAPMCGPMPA